MNATIRIDDGGTITFIYADDLIELTEQGDTTVERVSHVEPMIGSGPVRWQADMSPVGGPVLAGFTNRADALAAEVDWLQTNRQL